MTPQGAAATARASVGFARLAVAAAALMFVVVVASAFMRHWQAGLACPDWPACYGRVDAQAGTEPPLPVRAARLAHRVAASGVLVAIAGLLLVAWTQPPRRTREGTLAAIAFALAAGLAALGVAPAWAVCLSIGGRHAGVVSGAMNTFGNLGGMLSPVVVGGSLTAWGSWEAPLYSVAALYLAAAACWLGIDPAAPLDVTAPAAGRAAA